MQRPDETWHRLANWTYAQASSERLAAQILYSEGFTSVDPSNPLGGPDGGADALCIKDNTLWVMAVYFPRRPQNFTSIKKKFLADLEGVKKNNGTGFVFVTNQELTIKDRNTLGKLCGNLKFELYHLERLVSILDKPYMAPVRLQYLYIDKPFSEHYSSEIKKNTEYETATGNSNQKIKQNSHGILAIESAASLTANRLYFALIWWLLCGLIPALSLYFSFGNEGIFFAQIYPHFFLYPLLVGFLAAFCLFPALGIVFGTLKKSRLIILSSIIFIFSCYGTYADVSTGDPALWEYKNISKLVIPGQGLAIIEAHDLVNNCQLRQGIIFGRVLQNSSCTQKRDSLRKFMRTQQQIQETSITWIFYVISLFIQILTLGFSIACIGILVVYKSKEKFKATTIDINMAFTFFFYFLWIPMRLYALNEKSNLYGSITALSELPIGIIVLGCYFYSIRLTLLTSRDFTIHAMQAVTGLILMYCAITQPHLLALFFGRDSIPTTYPLIPIVLIMLFIPWILASEGGLKADKEK